MDELLLHNVVLQNFLIPNVSYKVEENTTGLINRSYTVKDTASNPRFFLQRIDTTVFQDIDGLMANIEHIIAHFKDLQDAPSHLQLIPTIQNKSYFRANDGSCWRLYNHCEGKSFATAKNSAIAALVGTAYGSFLKALEGIDASVLHVTIPKFHDIRVRHAQFNEALTSALPERLQHAKTEIGFVHEVIPRWVGFYTRLEASCALRATHNDTKLNNVLIRENGTATVVDYDTIMPGYLAFDFGDAVRTICSTTPEDHRDLQNVRYDLTLLKSFAFGFIKALDQNSAIPDYNFFAAATGYMPFIIGLRMLTDYLNNDNYFATSYPEHNIDRARNQFALSTYALAKQEDITRIILTETNQQHHEKRVSN